MDTVTLSVSCINGVDDAGEGDEANYYTGNGNGDDNSGDGNRREGGDARRSVIEMLLLLLIVMMLGLLVAMAMIIVGHNEENVVSGEDVVTHHENPPFTQADVEVEVLTGEPAVGQTPNENPVFEEDALAVGSEGSSDDAVHDNGVISIDENSNPHFEEDALAVSCGSSDDAVHDNGVVAIDENSLFMEEDLESAAENDDEEKLPNSAGHVVRMVAMTAFAIVVTQMWTWWKQRGNDQNRRR